MCHKLIDEYHTPFETSIGYVIIYSIWYVNKQLFVQVSVTKDITNGFMAKQITDITHGLSTVDIIHYFLTKFTVGLTELTHTASSYSSAVCVLDTSL